MVRDVLFRTNRVVHLFKRETGAVQDFAREFGWADLSPFVPGVVGAQKSDEVHDIAVFDDKATVHERFGGAKARVHDDIARHFGVRQSDNNFRETGRWFAINAGTAVCEDHAEAALRHTLVKELVEEFFAHTNLYGDRP